MLRHDPLHSPDLVSPPLATLLPNSQAPVISRDHFQPLLCHPLLGATLLFEPVGISELTSQDIWTIAAHLHQGKVIVPCAHHSLHLRQNILFDRTLKSKEQKAHYFRKSWVKSLDATIYPVKPRHHITLRQ